MVLGIVLERVIVGFGRIVEVGSEEIGKGTVP